MELNDYLAVMGRYWKVITAAALIGALGGGVFGILLRPAGLTEFTASTQGVLLTTQAREELQIRLNTARSFTATTSALVNVPSLFDQVATNDDFTKARIPSYITVLRSDVVLSPLAQAAGLELIDFRDKISIGNPGGSTVIDITVADPDPAEATRLSRQLYTDLVSQVQTLEDSPVEIKNLGTVIEEPSLPADAPDNQVRQVGASIAQQLIAENPANAVSTPTAVFSLFGDAEFGEIVQQLNLISTPETLRSKLKITAGIPTTTTPLDPAAPPLTASAVSFTITDTDGEQAANIVRTAMDLLQQRVGTAYGKIRTGASPLVVTEFSVADSGLLAGTPASTGSRTSVNVILGFLIGSAIGVGYAFYRASQDTTIRTVRQLVELTGAAPFGVIDVNPNGPTNPWVELDETAAAAEGYRALRSSLMFGGSGANVLTITAPTPGAGALTVGVNLAIALSQAGSKVCLVDAALRDPRLAQSLGLSTSPGLTEILGKGTELDSVLQTWSPGALSALTAGSPAANPSELLTSQAFTSLIERLQRSFDYVVCITSPALASTDAAVVGRRTDGVLVVLRHDQTTSTQLEAAASSLLQVGAPIIGTVLNAVPADESLFWRVITAPEQTQRSASDSAI